MRVLRTVTSLADVMFVHPLRPQALQAPDVPPFRRLAADTPQINPAVHERVSLLSGRQRLMRTSWVAVLASASGPHAD
jgi:hypothetical protein